MPPKRSTRSQSKAASKDKKKKDEEEEEEESEEEEVKDTKKGKKGAKGSAKAGKKDDKGKMDTEDAPSGKRVTRSSAKKADSDEESEEEEKPKKAKGKGRGRKASKGSDDEEDDEDEKPTKKVKRGKAKKRDDDDEDDEDEDDDKGLVKVVTKGGAAVDTEWTGPDCHVYNDGKTVYAKTLNQSNLNRNNNKFYIIQLLETEGKNPRYYTWNRWGRVGVRGQVKSTSFGTVDKAIKDFEKKLHEKTVKGDYIVVDINYDEEDEEDEEDDKKKTDTKKADKKDDKDDEESDDDKKKKDTKKPEAKKSDKEEKKDEKQEVKVITKGGVAIDQYFDEKDCEIYVANGKVYAKSLNQSNLNHNNNKFYIIQLLKSTKDPNVFYTWNRWGRVGVKGQNAKKKFSDAASAIADFEKKFRDKTVSGDYVEVEINYDDDEEEKEDTEKKSGDDKESKLPAQVKDLIKLIFDIKMMNTQMKEIGYDPKKMPLGKLSKNAIQKGYEILKQLADAIANKKSTSVFNDLSGQFFSYIPHDFGFQKMSTFVIDTDKKVKEKLEMLGSLEDIQIATKLLGDSGGSDENVVDTHYKKLKCGLEPIAKNSEEWKLVTEFIKNTHASTHSNYQLELVDLFTTDREGEDARYTKSLHNKMLLWHGSRLTNYVGILSQGLRIAPPEAPVTGYMFGKGVYFADMVSKSANYCFTNPANNTGIMLLCEVALGNCNEKLHADYYANNLPAGKHSTKGLGKTAPPESSYKKIDGDVQVPIGKGEPVNVPGAALLYNEFIVYDVNQIKLRYLLRLKFNYRSNY